MDGYRWVDAQFLNSFPPGFLRKLASNQRLLELYGSSSFTALIAIPTGVLAAIYLEEYAS